MSLSPTHNHQNVSSSVLNAPLTPNRNSNRNVRSVTPGRRAAISEAFEAVKLDDETALYNAMNKSSRSALGDQHSNNNNNNTTFFDCNATEPRNPKNTSLLHWATYLGSHGCFEMLLSFNNKINVNIEETDGKTPLHYAAFQGNMEMIAALRDADADMTRPDVLGQTPCHLARMNGKEEAAKMFPNYQDVLLQGIAKEVHSDANFVPGNDGNGNVLDSFVSPQSTNSSPHLRFGNQQQQSRQTSASPDYQHQLSDQQQAPLVNPNVFASPFALRSPQLHPRYQQDEIHHDKNKNRRSTSANSNNKRESFADMISSPFKNQQQQQQQQQQHLQSDYRNNVDADIDGDDDDPALRENSEELRQLAADEANLEAMEREIELEETAQRVAQAQVAWLEGIRSIAQQQNTFGSDNQLSERLWELCTSIESRFFLGPSLAASSSSATTTTITNQQRNEIERKASLQLRTVTMNVERQLLEKRAKLRQYPVVSFRWTPDAFQHLMNKANLDSHYQHHQQHQHNSVTSNVLSPMSTSNLSNTNRPKQYQQQQHQQPFRSIRVSSNSRGTSQISSIAAAGDVGTTNMMMEPEPQPPLFNQQQRMSGGGMSKGTWKKPPSSLTLTRR